jgi:hypothetical protein
VAEWMGAAVSAAEALRFLFQILHLSVLHEAEERECCTGVCNEQAPVASQLHQKCITIA